MLVNKKKSILITSISRKVWLINWFYKALNNLKLRSEYEIIVTDMDKFAAGLYQSDRAFLSKYKTSSKQFLPYFLEISKKYNIKLILPTRDGELDFFSKNRIFFEKMNVIIPISDSSSINICRDKVLFSNWMEKKGFKTPRIFKTSELLSYDEDKEVFIKPRTGAGSFWAMKIKNSKVEKILELNSDLVIQDYIEGKEITIDVFCSLDSEIISIVPRERLRIVRGESHVGRTISNERIFDEVYEIANSIKLKGPSTFQCIFTPEKSIYWLEINPRIGGGAALGFKAGNQTLENLIRLAEGEELVSTLGVYKTDLYFFRYSIDTFLDRESLNDRINYL